MLSKAISTNRIKMTTHNVMDNHYRTIEYLKFCIPFITYLIVSMLLTELITTKVNIM